MSKVQEKSIKPVQINWRIESEGIIVGIVDDKKVVRISEELSSVIGHHFSYNYRVEMRDKNNRPVFYRSYDGDYWNLHEIMLGLSENEVPLILAIFDM